MRGTDSKQEGMCSYVSPESRISAIHPLRPIRATVAEVLAGAVHGPQPDTSRGQHQGALVRTYRQGTAPRVWKIGPG